MRLLGPFSDRYLRQSVLFILSTFLNFLLFLSNGFLGFWAGSSWQIALSAYYLGLTLIRLCLICLLIRLDGIADERRCHSLKWIRLTADLGILLLEIVLGGIFYLSATGKGRPHYPGFLIYGVALYAFIKVINATVRIVRARKKGQMIHAAVRDVGLVDAMVSILMLETALISVFGSGSGSFARGSFASVMISTTGAVIWLLALAISLSGIVTCYRAGLRFP